VSAIVGGEFEAGVNSPSGTLGEDDADVERMRCDEIGGGIKPDVAIDGAYGRLRLIPGTEDGVLKSQVAKGEVFVMHTHPVMASEPGHFRLDVSVAGKHVEAVIDWSGQITYYNKTGLKNPVRNGLVDPMEIIKLRSWMTVETSSASRALTSLIRLAARKSRCENRPQPPSCPRITV
jgi:hypothetical protein